MKKAKKYPFNMSKHQHDIFYRYNKAKNEEDDKFYDGTLTADEADKYEALIEALDNLLSYGIGIVWLTGKEWALANETVAWAEATRDRR